MYSYKAYSLGLHSVLPLPELIAAETEMDVMIQLGNVATSPPEGQEKGYHYWRSGQDVYLFWEELGTFRIREGREITIAPAPQIDERRLSPPILGACMAVLLQQQGYLILHASAVAFPDGAIAFLGDKGWGKSTMAAALQVRGYPLLTDDVLAVKLDGDNQPIALPAFPQVKLWPSAVTALGGDPESLPRIVPQLNKRVRRLTEDFSPDPITLKKIYLLGKGAALAIEPFPFGEVLGQLFRHSYSGRFGKQLLHQGEAFHFRQCMELAKQVPIYHLQRPSALSLLPEIAQCVEDLELV